LQDKAAENRGRKKRKKKRKEKKRKEKTKLQNQKATQIRVHISLYPKSKFLCTSCTTQRQLA